MRNMKEIKRMIAKWILVAIAIAVLLALVFANILRRQRKTTIVEGDISTVKDKQEEIIEVKLLANDNVVYMVVLDAKGKNLAVDMDGKEVEALGTVQDKDGEKWLTVESYVELKYPRKGPFDRNKDQDAFLPPPDCMGPMGAFS